MTWKEISPMDQRLRFIAAAMEESVSFTALCKSFDISRRTGYKWKRRYQESGLDGLKELSRAPLNHGRACSKEVRALIIEAKKLHPTWGPKKIAPWLKLKHSGLQVPAVSTIGKILKDLGMVKPRRRRRKLPSTESNRVTPTKPNDTWCADFKGQFLLKNRRYCYPLTVTDAYSRYLLDCTALPGTKQDPAIEVFQRIFRKYGLPKIIRTDNGVPFASNAVAGLSKLSIWWLKLGIKLDRIDPGHPEQNGQHERMHRTLKAETTKPPAYCSSKQQIKFDAFTHEFNSERPHEALEFTTPASWYEHSTIAYPETIPEPEYPSHFLVRRVRQNGEIKLFNNFVFVSESLSKETVGLVERVEDLWELRFGEILLGLLDRKTMKLQPLGRKRRRKSAAKRHGQVVDGQRVMENSQSYEAYSFPQRYPTTT